MTLACYGALQIIGFILIIIRVHVKLSIVSYRIVPRRQSHRRSGPVNLPSVGAVP